MLSPHSGGLNGLEVRLSECVRTGSISGEAPTPLPWHLRHTIRPLVVDRAQGMLLTSCQCSRADKGTTQQIVDLVVPWMATRAMATRQTVVSIGCDCLATDTNMWADNRCTETQATAMRTELSIFKPMMMMMMMMMIIIIIINDNWYSAVNSRVLQGRLQNRQQWRYNTKSTTKQERSLLVR